MQSRRDQALANFFLSSSLRAENHDYHARYSASRQLLAAITSQSSLPWQSRIAALTIPFLALLFGALALVEWTGRTLQIEGRDHTGIRCAHIAYAAITNFGIAFTGQLFHYHINSTQNPSTFGDTVRFMSDTPSVLWIGVAIALFFSLFALPDAIRVEGRAWSEFYGDNLEAALAAGRGVERAEHHDIPPVAEGISARELLGLAPGFTKAQLRAAWLRLARELHPDRWSSAGPAVRTMKEAALKRVNAARDELAPLAV